MKTFTSPAKIKIDRKAGRALVVGAMSAMPSQEPIEAPILNGEIKQFASCPMTPELWE
jgi:hypothetical protein